MISKIADDFDYDQSSDGYVMMGPVKNQGLDDIRHLMESHGVLAFTDTCDVSIDRQADCELYVTAVSEDVTGYFLDQDGHEAATSDVEAFLIDLLEDGAEINVRGCYPDGRDGTIFTKARFRKVDDAILRDVDRTAVRADGTQSAIVTLEEVMDHEASQVVRTHGDRVIALDVFRRRRAA